MNYELFMLLMLFPVDSFFFFFKEKQILHLSNAPQEIPTLSQMHKMRMPTASPPTTTGTSQIQQLICKWKSTGRTAQRALTMIER